MTTPEERIALLTRDLKPVRRIPPLRVAFGALVASGLMSVAVIHAIRAPATMPDLLSDPMRLGIVIGLTLASLGAALAALAGSVPGRERATSIGLGTTTLGGLVGIASGLLAVDFHADRLAWNEVVACMDCIVHAIAFGLASSALAYAFVAWAAVRARRSRTAFALLAGVGFGAVAVHLHCPIDSAVHQTVSHLLAPVLAAIVFTLPLAAALGRDRSIDGSAVR